MLFSQNTVILRTVIEGIIKENVLVAISEFKNISPLIRPMSTFYNHKQNFDRLGYSSCNMCVISFQMNTLCIGFVLLSLDYYNF